MGVILTAVPYAEKIVAVPLRMSLVSKSVRTTALAPIVFAFSISLCIDSLRAFSASELYDVTSPPNIPSIPAIIFPPTPLVRTVMP